MEINANSFFIFLSISSFHLKSITASDIDYPEKDCFHTKIEEEQPSGTNFKYQTNCLPIFSDEKEKKYLLSNLQGMTRFRILNTEKFSNYIDINENSGELFIKKKVNREELCKESQLCCNSPENTRLQPSDEPDCILEFSLKAFINSSRILLSARIRVALMDMYV